MAVYFMLLNLFPEICSCEEGRALPVDFDFCGFENKLYTKYFYCVLFFLNFGIGGFGKKVVD